MRLVLDTNCLLVIVPKKSQYRKLFDSIILGDFEIVVTSEILLEYEEQLSLFYSSTYASLIINSIINLPNIVRVESIYFNWLLLSIDVDDNKFIDAYIAGQADVIITNDRHFDFLRKVEFPEVKCLKLSEFIKTLG